MKDLIHGRTFGQAGKKRADGYPRSLDHEFATAEVAPPLEEVVAVKAHDKKVTRKLAAKQSRAFGQCRGITARAGVAVTAAVGVYLDVRSGVWFWMVVHGLKDLSIRSDMRRLLRACFSYFP